MMRLGLRAAVALAAGYVNLMRSVPLVLVIFWFYFLVPYIGQWVTGASQPIQVGAFVSSLVTFTLFEAAYFAEIMRAGIQSIPRGQVAAAQALGMTYLQTMGYIVLPQAFRNMLPVLLTQTIILFQDTSLVYVLSITDFLGAASKVAQRRTPGGDVPVRRAGLFRDLVRGFAARAPAAAPRRDQVLRMPHDHAREGQQVVLLDFQVLKDCSTEVAKGEVVVVCGRRARASRR